ncbi:MAG: hypothetical protein IKD23_07595 [Lentisphaeria bacterium]|nr:hypothetical protein [Lentisphaeria bacterium]
MMDHSNRNVIYKEISSEDAEKPDFRSAVSDDACGEPERSDGTIIKRWQSTTKRELHNWRKPIKAKRRYKTKKLLSESNQTGVLPSFFPKKRFLLCIMGNPAPCGRRSRSHIHSMLLCLLLAKPGIAAYCCAKNKSIKASEAAATIRFFVLLFFS